MKNEKSSQNKPRVIFVDDEPFYSRQIINELESDFNVEYFEYVNEAIPRIRSVCEPFILILDVMMPPPELELIAETENGHLTGFWMLSQIAKILRDTGSPVFCLTNIDLIEAKHHFHNFAITDILIEIEHKGAVTPESMLKRLKNLAAKHL